MNPLINVEHVSFQEVFASTLIHSLWQGAILVIMMWLIRNALPQNTRFNYIISLLGLVTMMVMSIITFSFLWNQNTIGFSNNSAITKIFDKPELLEWINNLWLIGSCIFLFRFLFSHYYLTKLIKQSKPIINSKWNTVFNQLKHFYSINESIILLQTDQVGSAFLTGVLKPVIIVPVSWVNQLSLKEAECILAHELSHVIHKDHWVNLFIQFSEIIFYFNPAVHILISHIKLERELKADSSACNYLKAPLLYAKLILKIEESALLAPANTLPFFQQKSQLKRRIESVLQIKTSRSDFTSRIAILALTISVLFFSSISVKPLDNTIQSINSQQLQTELCKAQMPKLNIPSMPSKKAFGTITEKPLNKIHSKIHVYQDYDKPDVAQKEISEQIDTNNEDNDYLAYQDESLETDVLQQIENEIKAERNNRKTIIYEISKNTEVDSNEAVNSSNWIVPRQIKYYAPVETKTYIIIRTSTNTNFDSEQDGNIPGKIRIQSIR